jgi:hypothetical protein
MQENARKQEEEKRGVFEAKIARLTKDISHY